MQIPKRKSEELRRLNQPDGPIYMTADGVENMKRSVARIEKEIPSVREELIATREMGDLSENAGYQIAKHKLRSLQGRLLSIQEQLKHVVVIEPSDTDTVQLGSTVTLDMQGTERTFQVVGPKQADPLRGRISHVSPLGSALLGKAVGDDVALNSQTSRILKIK